MRFAHMADCHLGGWRDPRMRALGSESFHQATDACIHERVDFVLICGDFFNTAIPSIDVMKEAVRELMRLKDNKIPVYCIPGSHDYSPNGKTVLDVLQEAGLLRNVFRGSVDEGTLRLRFTRDDKTGTNLTGILGKRGSLEKAYYEMLDTASLEQEPGTKIFLYHSPIEEFKGAGMGMMEAVPLSFFPKGFIYYAGGHVHTVMHQKEQGFGTFAYPGPLFPNNFSELEELGGGGFYIVDIQGSEAIPKRIDIKGKPIRSIVIDCTGLTPMEVSERLLDAAKDTDAADAIVLIRVFGDLLSGSVADIAFRQAIDAFYIRGAYFVMRSTRNVQSPEMADIIEGEHMGTQEIEESIIREHAAQVRLPAELAGLEKDTLRSLIIALSIEKAEGETQPDFEARLDASARDILRLQR